MNDGPPLPPPAGGDDPVTAIVADVLVRAAGVRDERERLRRLVARHQRRLDSLRAPNGKDALEAIAAIVSERTGLVGEVSGPFGMGPEWPMSFKEADGASAAFVMFRGGGDAALVEMVDLDSDDGSAPNTLARRNGLHRRGLPMPSLDGLVAHVQGQRAVARLRRVAGLSA